MGGGNLTRTASATANHVNHLFAVTSSNQLIERDGEYSTGAWTTWVTPQRRRLLG
ncbi:hypothetical protein ACH47Z_36050 [Streptomyces sp. NPDC020192]|uniref:hypothetical protein n=1 Tax=Streptomyces sp. NPDC020192 TaxID=3365066 RepID=UPI0037B81723